MHILVWPHFFPHKESRKIFFFVWLFLKTNKQTIKQTKKQPYEVRCYRHRSWQSGKVFLDHSDGVLQGSTILINGDFFLLILSEKKEKNSKHWVDSRDHHHQQKQQQVEKPNQCLDNNLKLFNGPTNHPHSPRCSSRCGRRLTLQSCRQGSGVCVCHQLFWED